MVKEINFKEKIPLTHHLIELKNRLVQVTLVVAVFFGVCFYFIDFLLLWLEDPLPKQYADLTFITPTEPFFTAMKVSFMGSIFISMPWILYHVWGFIAPGLKVKEKKITALFVAFGTAFFLFGGLFCYFLVEIFAYFSFPSFCRSSLFSNRRLFHHHRKRGDTSAPRERER